MGATPPIAGIDFGTSNSVVAVSTDPGSPRFAGFPLLGDRTQSFRSLLFFDLEEQERGGPLEYAAGPEGIEAYLDTFGEGRLIQSFKTHLSSENLGRTLIGHKGIDIEGLLTLFLRRLRLRAQADLAVPVERAVFGRPVQFAGAEHAEANARAEGRLRAAAAQAGISEVHVELEPIAAAYHYEAQLDHDEVALVADFGAGTTDFCVMRIGPTRRGSADRGDDVLATGGVGVAGDDLDAALIQHVVAPELGKGTRYREFGKVLEIPPSYYHKLSHWHQLSFLRTKRTHDDLARLLQHAEKPEAIAALMMIIEDNQGFHLHKSVEAAKIALSNEARAEFRYEHDAFTVVAPVTRADFDTWIADEVAAIASCIDETLASAGLDATDVDRVFMTGGTAFVPMVRREFAARFGAEKLSRGDELSSIAAGLAACGRRLGSA